jgi:hypothetical protein
VTVNPNFTKAHPLVIGNPDDGEPIRVLAEHYGRTMFHEELWIAGDGADEAIDAGLYSILDGETGGADPPAAPPVVEPQLPDSITIPVED